MSEENPLAETIERLHWQHDPSGAILMTEPSALNRDKEDELPEELQINECDELLENLQLGEDSAEYGTPKKRASLVRKLGHYLETHPEEAERIIKALVDRGKKGDIVAIREIMDRIDGKPAERHKFEGELPIRLVFVPAEELLQNLPERAQDAKIGPPERKQIPAVTEALEPA